MGNYKTTQNGRPVTVSFTDGETLRDVADLWAVLDGEYRGTPSTESESLRSMLANLQGGAPLSSAEWAILKRLKDKYAKQLEDFRMSSDGDTQGYVPLPDAGMGRVAEAAQLGLLREQYAVPSTTKQDQATSAPHLADSILHDLAHSRQHIARLLDPDVLASVQSIKFNAEHALNHAESAQDHAKKLDKHLATHPSDPKAWGTERAALNDLRAPMAEAWGLLPAGQRERLREAADTASLDAIFSQANGGYGDMWINDTDKKVVISFGDWEGDLASDAQRAAETVYPGYAIDSETEQGDPSEPRRYDPATKEIVTGSVPGWRQVYAKGKRVGALTEAQRLREGESPPPPNLRPAAPHDEATEATSTTPVHECGTCAMALAARSVPTVTEVVAADPATGGAQTQRPTIAVDFDGVIHEGSHGMPGEVEGEPVEGAKEALAALHDRYRVVVLTARQDFAAVRGWLQANGMGDSVDLVTNVKPEALGYIDDRAIHFVDWKTALAAADPTKASYQPIVVKKTFEASRPMALLELPAGLLR